MAYRRRYRMAVPRRTYRVSRFGRQSRSFRRNMLSTLQQRDLSRFTIKTRREFTVVIPGGKVAAAEAYSAWQMLAQDPQFAAMKTLFDQVKINGVRLQLRSSVNISSSSTAVPTIVYAWDRNGVEWSGTDSGEDKYMSICSYGSSRISSLAPSSHNQLRTQIVAQDIQERTMYISTASMNQTTVSQNYGQVYFKPTFMIGASIPSDVTGDTTFVWEVEAAFDCTFRGTRYSQ